MKHVRLLMIHGGKCCITQGIQVLMIVLPRLGLDSRELVGRQLQARVKERSGTG